MWAENGCEISEEAGTEHMDEAGLLRGRGRIGCRRAFKLPQLRQRSIIFLDLETESGTPFYRMQGEYRWFSRYRAITQEGSPVANMGSAHCPVLTTLTCSQLVERKRTPKPNPRALSSFVLVSLSYHYEDHCCASVRFVYLTLWPARLCPLKHTSNTKQFSILTYKF